MKIKKKIIGTLEKCYSLSLLDYHGAKHILVAAEKVNNCELFDLGGRKEAVIWKEPGGVMTIAQLPGSDGVFFATQKFYSPDDSEQARIVIAEPNANKWEVRTLFDLPFVHRFDIIPANGTNYLIACTIKSGHKYKGDWSSPGKIYAVKLPEDLSSYDAGHQLKPDVILEGLVKNHGYTRFVGADGSIQAVVSADCGVFRLTPPSSEKAEWKIEQLLDVPASDAQLIDLDSDGEAELCVFTPFHGDTLQIYRKNGRGYRLAYEYPHKLEFLHAICGCTVGGKPILVAGNRKGERNLMAFYWDSEKESYLCEILDRNCGAANVMHFIKDGKDFLVGANREINQITLYELTVEQQRIKNFNRKKREIE
jgi:hypothetical protein